jgi:hypothetical protein
MAAQIVPLFRRFHQSNDWTQRELAEFYRVESALVQAGLQLETDRGLTDEGDPWFVFCRTDSGEVFIHFARIGGQYVAVGAALEQVVQGRDFPTLVQEMLAAQAWVMAKARNTPNVFIHPAALLIALVGGAFFHSSDAKAAETVDHGRPELRRHVLPILFRDISDKLAPVFDANETATILSSVLIGLNGLSSFAPPIASNLPSGLTASLSTPIALPIAPALVAPALVAPTSHTAAALADPVTSQALLDLAPQHSSATPSFNMEFALPAASGILSDQAVIDATAAFTGLATPIAHLDYGAALAANSTVLLQISSTDAAEIVQSSSITGYLEPQPGVTPFVAPASLTSLIKQGEHATSTTSPTPSTNDGHGGSAPPAEGGGEPAPSLLSGELTANNPLVIAALAQFAAEVSVLDIAFSGHEIILYDGAILKPLPAGTQLDSFTFNFTDGSSISLVGTATELHNLHLQG